MAWDMALRHMEREACGQVWRLRPLERRPYWTFRNRTPISQRVNRFLLALVALLTGLAANAAPAQARLAGAERTEIGALQNPAAVLRCGVAVVSARARSAPQNAPTVPLAEVSAAYPVPRVASVQLQADRAHE